MHAATRLLIVGLEGASPAAWQSWSADGRLPFLTETMGQVRPAGLHPSPAGGRRAAWRPLLHGRSGLCNLLAEYDVPLGALGFPEPAPVGPGSFSAGGTGTVTQPPGLAADLADYQDEPSFAASGVLTLHRPADLDQLSAELAALALLQREHALRLAARYRPRVLAVNFGGFRHALAAFWTRPERLALLLGQYDANARALWEAWSADRLAVVSPYALGPAPGAPEPDEDPPRPSGVLAREAPGLLLLIGDGQETEPTLSPVDAARTLAAAAGAQENSP